MNRPLIMVCTILLLIIVITLVIVVQYQDILRTGEEASPVKTDVILVLGAGVWEGGPSPALVSRTQHAAELYKQGFAPYIIVSGGLGEHPPTEAEAMQNILVEHDVPREAIILEDRAKNTAQNLAYSYELMEENEWSSVLIVTDVFHVKRAKLVAQDLPVEVHASGVKESILYQNSALRVRYTLREVLALNWYRISGQL
ncbi:YdcF family protein [Caldalkalibacillus salinus]|uniref:YdcF family protein n=1 Tax=Caldalkalibacillus salinus TaxID=2803787 RepID=UPI0019218F3E|nr:YdcF family protein [Caldalkalibacillus salinus]